MSLNESVTLEKTEGQNKSVVITSLITSLFTFLVLTSVIIFAFKPLDKINQNLQAQQKQIEEVQELITVSREELETQVRAYINKNYGVLSERDEKVDKLMIYFRQQDARLSNIEKALSKF